MIVRAKFYVVETTQFANGDSKVRMLPVTGGSDENKSFSKYTPSGEFWMQVTVPETAALYKPGDEILIDMHIPGTPDGV